VGLGDGLGEGVGEAVGLGVGVGEPESPPQAARVNIAASTGDHFREDLLAIARE
jgi:hypothetical protein